MFPEMSIFRRFRERFPMTVCRYSLAYPFVLVHCIHTRRIIRPSARNKFLVRALIFLVCCKVARCRVGRSCVLQLKDILNTLTILTIRKHRDRFLVKHLIVLVVESESNHLIVRGYINTSTKSQVFSSIFVLSVFQRHSNRKSSQLVSLVI